MDKHYFYLLIIGIMFISMNCILMSSFYLSHSVDKRNNFKHLPISGNEKRTQSIFETSKYVLRQNNKTISKQKIVQTKRLKAKALRNLEYFFSKIKAHYSFVNRAVYKLIEDLHISNNSNLVNKNAWRIASEWSNPHNLLPDNADILGSIISNLKTVKVIYADIGYKGTQLKMTLTLRGMQRTVFKPKWYSLDDVIEGHVYSGADRHNGEAAAFYLGRILGMNNVPIATMRKLSLRDEILPVASQKLAKTFLAKDSKTCFYGVCYFCSKENYVCDDGKFLEGVIILWLPTKLQLTSLPHPWARTYNVNKSASWENNEDYCSTLKAAPYYIEDSSNRLLQLINLSIFDFLIQNGDRHHYNVFSGEQKSSLIMIDNGKSFGDPHTDHLDILAPLLQCCVISRYVYNRLVLLSGGGLSLALKKLSVDNVPLLADDHFQAIDRRLSIILAAIRACKKVKGGWDYIFV